MKNVYNIEFRNGSREEVLSGMEPDFPYIASYVEFDKYVGGYVPWHWHNEVEMFYLKSGILEYHTPKGKTVFPAGSGGFVNSNVLHMTRPHNDIPNTIQFDHIFDPILISGFHGSRIEEKYVTPFITAPQIELLAFYPDNPLQKPIVDALRRSFELAPKEDAYELKLRSALSGIWFQFLQYASPLLETTGSYNKTNDKLKQMLIYIHEHYPEKISIAELSSAAFISERECFRAFHDCLHTTPIEYIRSYRLQAACHMLAEGKKSLTDICQSCGLGSSSYFGKVFREQMGCTPLEYRNRWQDSDIKRQK